MAIMLTRAHAPGRQPSRRWLVISSRLCARRHERAPDADRLARRAVVSASVRARHCRPAEPDPQRPNRLRDMGLFPPTALLCRELRRVLPERPFAIEFWDGGRVPATAAGAPTFHVRRASAIAHALRAPGPLGI